jgi:hypothetical protein
LFQIIPFKRPAFPLFSWTVIFFPCHLLFNQENNVIMLNIQNLTNALHWIMDVSTAASIP